MSSQGYLLGGVDVKIQVKSSQDLSQYGSQYAVHVKYVRTHVSEYVRVR